MLRGMIFMDFMNFDSELQRYYATLGERTPRLDYNQMFYNIVNLQQVDFLKACIFAPEPDEFLIEDERMYKKYKWIQGMATTRYVDVIFGRYVARPTNPDIAIDIHNRNTFYKVEKGTDVNLAINLLNKAHHNAFDTAFIISADTDYIAAYRLLKSMGKLVVVVMLKGQYFKKLLPEVDDYIILDKIFFDSCLREQPITTQVWYCNT